MLDYLKKLCGIAGPSGRETAVANYIEHEIAAYAEVKRDPLGNLLVFKKGESRAAHKVMLCAHTDEVGLIITYIRADGTLLFDTVGGIDPRVLAGRRVLIGEKGIPGVVGMKTLHLLSRDEERDAPGLEKLCLDIGAPDADDAAQLVSPGDTAVFDAEFVEFGSGFIKARAIDDRMGCAILIEMIKAPQPYDLSFAFTVQEEVGSAGAKAAAFTLQPETAIVLESTTAADLAGVPEEKRVCFAGKGPVVSFMDRLNVYDKGLYDLAFRLAKEQKILCQPKLAVAGGNDAGAIHLSRGGVRTAALSLPCRYLHSPSCVIQWNDAQATLRLAAALASAAASGTPAL